MRRIHLIFGVTLFVVFLMTGQSMRADFPDKDSIDQYLRVLMRSRHIYILFSALIHIALGTYLELRAPIYSRALQYLGSILLTVASVLLVWAFVTETYQLQHFSDFSRFGIYASLAGVSLHVIGGLAGKRDQ